MARKTDGELISDYLLVKGYLELEAGMMGGAKYRQFKILGSSNSVFIAKSGQMRGGPTLDDSSRSRPDIAQCLLTDAKLYFKPVEVPV